MVAKSALNVKPPTIFQSNVREEVFEANESCKIYIYKHRFIYSLHSVSFLRLLFKSSQNGVKSWISS